MVVVNKCKRNLAPALFLTKKKSKKKRTFKTHTVHSIQVRYVFALISNFVKNSIRRRKNIHSIFLGSVKQNDRKLSLMKSHACKGKGRVKTNPFPSLLVLSKAVR